MSKISTFAARCMQLITGQMPLPQGKFRSFLEELTEDLSMVETSADSKMPIPSSATNGNFARFDSNKKVVDSGTKASDFMPAGAITVLEGKLVFAIGESTYTVTPDATTDAEE